MAIYQTGTGTGSAIQNDWICVCHKSTCIQVCRAEWQMRCLLCMLVHASMDGLGLCFCCLQALHGCPILPERTRCVRWCQARPCGNAGHGTHPRFCSSDRIAEVRGHMANTQAHLGAAAVEEVEILELLGEGSVGAFAEGRNWPGQGRHPTQRKMPQVALHAQCTAHVCIARTAHVAASVGAPPVLLSTMAAVQKDGRCSISYLGKAFPGPFIKSTLLTHASGMRSMVWYKHVQLYEHTWVNLVFKARQASLFSFSIR